MAAALPDRVSQGLLGEILHLGQPELLALVDVGAARQAEEQEDRGARPAQAEDRIGGRRRVHGDVVDAGQRPSEARRVAGLVVVREDPRGRRPDGADVAKVQPARAAVVGVDALPRPRSGWLHPDG